MILTPDSRYPCTACAFASGKCLRHYPESAPVHHFPAAGRTNGIITPGTGEISNIDVFHSCSPGYFCRLCQNAGRCGGKVFQLVLRLEAAEMKRSVSESVLSQPVAHLPDLIRLIGPSRYNQVCDLQPDTLIPVDFEAVKNGLKPASCEFEICIVTE